MNLLALITVQERKFFAENKGNDEEKAELMKSKVPDI